jgi:hypothetical protein
MLRNEICNHNDSTLENEQKRYILALVRFNETNNPIHGIHPKKLTRLLKKVVQPLKKHQDRLYQRQTDPSITCLAMLSSTLIAVKTWPHSSDVTCRSGNVFWKGVLEHLGEGGRETRRDVRLAAEGEEGAEAEREDGADCSGGHDGSSETS